MGAQRWRKEHRDQYYFRKLNRQERKTRKHSKKLQRHHLLNRVNGGTYALNNILMLAPERHAQWHKLFKNDDPQYIIDVLTRMCRMKGYALKPTYMEEEI